MKPYLASKLGYSEKQMADAFLEVLQSRDGLPGIGTFDGIYREINCHQGRPDFITIRAKVSNDEEPLSKTIGFVGSLILSLLKPRSSRTLQYLLEKSEFSDNSVKRSLRQLLASGHIDKTEAGSYVLGVASSQFDAEIWAFELKLKNPKRAIFQAQQSRAFAERSIIVVPPDQMKNYERYSETMKRWGIGLATFDPLTLGFSMSRQIRKSRALLRRHQIYAIAQLYSERKTSLIKN